MLLIETSSYAPESDAIKALALPGYAASLLGIEGLTADSITDHWQERPRIGHIEGHVDNDEKRLNVSAIVQFPGFLKRTIAQAFNQDPKAILHLTVYSN